MNHIDKGKHYRFMYRGIKLDPARIFSIYNVTNALQMAIIKKALVPGNRGKKTIEEDIDDIITACVRWKEMIKEDRDLDQETTPLNFENR